MDLSLSMSQQLTTSTVLIGWLHSDKVRGERSNRRGTEREEGGGRNFDYSYLSCTLGKAE